MDTELTELADELDFMLAEAGGIPTPKIPGSAAVPTSAVSTPAAGQGARCPKGQHKYPDTGKCVPRETLRQLYRGHEPLASMHREKSAAHAQHAQAARMAGNHALADKHEKKAALHMTQAKEHHRQFTAIGNVLYPKRMGRPLQTTPDVKKPSANPGHAQELPQFKPARHSRFGGAAWGGSSNSTTTHPLPVHPSATPQPHPSAAPHNATPGYNPFGTAHSEPAHNPTTAAPEHPTPVPGTTGPHATPAPTTQEPAKSPSLLHKLGHAALSGLGTVAQQKAHATGSLGWAALGHTLHHLVHGPTQQTGAVNPLGATQQAPATIPSPPPVHTPAPPKKKIPPTRAQTQY